LLALVMGAAAWAAGNYRFFHTRARERIVRRRLKELGSAVVQEFGDQVREYPKTSAAVAALAGLALGEQALRHDMLKEHDGKDQSRH
jgi:hypothetical protein